MVAEEVHHKGPSAYLRGLEEAYVFKGKGAGAEGAKGHQAHALLVMYMYARLLEKGGKTGLRGRK